jgi:hypothetical protein
MGKTVGSGVSRTHAKAAEPHARRIGDLLKDYASRGVFRNVGEVESRGGKTTFTLLWHHDRVFRFVLDVPGRTVSFPALLPGVPARSSMAKELKTFLSRFATSEVPAHRRIDAARCRLQIAVRGRNASLALAVKDGDFEFAARRLVHLAQEVFMVFLMDGPYFDYRVEQLGLDPDTVWA